MYIAWFLSEAGFSLHRSRVAQNLLDPFSSMPNKCTVLLHYSISLRAPRVRSVRLEPFRMKRLTSVMLSLPRV